MKCETNPNNCPIEVTLSLIGGKYKPVILWFLIDHPLHYAELQRLIPKATPKMLSQQLHDLENSGIILILSILVYTFFSRMFDLMLPPVAKHSIVVA